MGRNRDHLPATRFLSDHGMVVVLLLLCAFFGVVTRAEQHPTGAPAARQLADAIAGSASRARSVIVVRASDEDAAFATELRRALEERGVTVLETVRGQPADARRVLTR